MLKEQNMIFQVLAQIYERIAFCQRVFYCTEEELEYFAKYRIIVFGIQFLFKYDAISSPACLASHCGSSLFNSFPDMMQSPLRAAWLAPAVV